MTSTYPKRLIEVDLPIARISAHARREKSIRHGHISTLHIWWARRPLAACRAVICAALWPDPADPLCPPAFREAAVRLLTAFAKRVNPDRDHRGEPSSCRRRCRRRISRPLGGARGGHADARCQTTRPTGSSCGCACSTSSPTSPTGTTRRSRRIWRPSRALDAGGARGARRRSRGRGRWSSIRSPAAARFRWKPCAWGPMRLPATSTLCRAAEQGRAGVHPQVRPAAGRRSAEVGRSGSSRRPRRNWPSSIRKTRTARRRSRTCGRGRFAVRVRRAARKSR